VTDVNVNPSDGTKATLVADVEETSEVHSLGQVSTPYSDQIRVGYDLIQKEGKWHIQAIKVLEKD